MNSRILNFFNVKLDAFIVFVSVVVVIMFIALFFLLLDYLKMRKRYVEFMTGESGKSLEYTIYKRFREIDKLKAARKIMMLRLLLFMICSEEITARSVFINMMHLM